MEKNQLSPIYIRHANQMIGSLAPKKKFLSITTLALVVGSIALIQSYRNEQANRQLDVDSINGVYRSRYSDVVQLRGVFFGTSRTFGSGLEVTPESYGIGRYNSYPFKTTSHVKNMAIQGTGPVSWHKSRALLSMLLLMCTIIHLNIRVNAF